MALKPKRKERPTSALLTWAKDTELVGLVLELQPERDGDLYPQYAIGLHAWFLDQVRRTDAELSAYLHDGQSEKPFTLSRLEGIALKDQPSVQASQTYRWYLTALSQPLVKWIAEWLTAPPSLLDLRGAPLTILNWAIAYPPTTYKQLLKKAEQTLSKGQSPTFALSFVSPTSFRHRGHHLPMPVPENVFHSYLRRWNHFSGEAIDQEDFLDWVDNFVVVSRLELQSSKVVAGKQGSVTGFTGSVEFGVLAKAWEDDGYCDLFFALGQLAPYCGTGHKTTFGLGQTRSGWLGTSEAICLPVAQDLLAHRIAELTERFVSIKKRKGGDRATRSAELWATILARRELGESLQAIGQDLEIPYETVKKYAQLAKKAVEG